MSINNCVLGCHSVSSRFISIYLRAAPFNITIVQAFAPVTNRGDDQADGFYNQLPKVIDKVDKKDIFIIQGDWNAKVGAAELKDLSVP